jgi:GPH family glycoside/pentoside/hexuronide:cation symporter
MLSAMMGALVAEPLVARFEKRHAYAGLQGAIVASLVVLFLLDRSQLVLIFLVYGAVEFFTKTASAMLWSMMADVVDYGEQVTGRRIAGLAFSGSLLALKMGMAIGGAALGWLLAYVGYESQAAVQSAGAVYGIVVLFTLVPAMGHLTLLAIVQFYRLDRRDCDEVRRALDAAASRHSREGAAT